MKRLIFICLLFVCSNVLSQDFDHDLMDSLFTHIENNDNGMGSISIFQNGEEVYSRAIGYIDIAASLNANEETKYRVGSVSKMFTATIIMRLAEEGKLKLDSTIDVYFPAIPNSDKITIKQLLSHRSGLFNYTNSPDYDAWLGNYHAREDVLLRITKFDPVFEPGTKAQYSNSNYALLTFIAEDISGKPYAELVETYVCGPCLLGQTEVGSEIDVDSNEALSYKKMGAWELATETDMSIPVGAGAIISTPTDLNRFMVCLFSEGLVSDKTLMEMMTLEDGFGLGLFQVPFYNRRAYGHTGGIDGFQSNAFYFSTEKVAIAYTANAVDMPINDIMIGALSVYFGRSYDFPEFTEPFPVTQEQLNEYLGVYASPSFPLKITVSKDSGGLIAQATGQPSFPLEAFDEHKFKFDQAQLSMEFIPRKEQMIFRQGGGQFLLTKEK